MKVSPKKKYLVILSSNTHYDDSLLYSALAAFPPDEDGQEAKFNLLLWKEVHLYYTVVFPRSKHRPDCYFAKGSEQMLISPGALDMAGVIVTKMCIRDSHTFPSPMHKTVGN